MTTARKAQTKKINARLIKTFHTTKKPIRTVQIIAEEKLVNALAALKERNVQHTTAKKDQEKQATEERKAKRREQKKQREEREAAEKKKAGCRGRKARQGGGAEEQCEASASAAITRGESKDGE